MEARKSARRLLLVVSLASLSFGQEAPPSDLAAAAAPEKISLREVSSVEVPSLPAESLGAPLLCDRDGRILFRLATPEAGVEDPVSVSKDGKTVIRFSREKITDIPRPSLLSFFILGSDAYVLTRGSTPLGYETKLRTPTGEVVNQPASKPGAWVAHFEHDGNYAGAVRLDIPFKPLHLGVFENGDFLIAGAEPSTDEPRGHRRL
jgi:hypothetical protein